METSNPLAQSIQDFIEEYGDRSPEELKLETQTFRSHPESLLKLLSQRLNQAHNPHSHPKKIKDSQISKRKPSNIFIRFLSKQAKLGIRNRELSRLHRTRLYGMTRTLMTTIGHRLFEEDVIDSPSDVFFLELNEIFEKQEIIMKRDYRSLIHQRREKQDRDQLLPAYSRLVYSDTIFEKSSFDFNVVSSQKGDQNDYYGQGCSPGQIQGQILVIQDVHQALDIDIKDKIIVTKMTDPGWVFILMEAKGIITEKGSILSHTAIISRELGIPAVVNVKDACQIFENGQRVAIDGLAGQIKRLKED